MNNINKKGIWTTSAFYELYNLNITESEDIPSDVITATTNSKLNGSVTIQTSDYLSCNEIVEY